MIQLDLTQLREFVEMIFDERTKANDIKQEIDKVIPFKPKNQPVAKPNGQEKKSASIKDVYWKNEEKTALQWILEVVDENGLSNPEYKISNINSDRSFQFLQKELETLGVQVNDVDDLKNLDVDQFKNKTVNILISKKNGKKNILFCK
jgi:hypothetical protein